MDLKNMIAKQ